jgi:predicted ATPase
LSESPLRARLEQEQANTQLVRDIRRILKIDDDDLHFKSGSVADLLRWAGGATKDLRRAPHRPEPEFYGQLIAVLSKRFAPVTNDREGLGVELARGDEETDTLVYATQELVNFFTGHVRYLGPLRAEPGQVQGFALSNQLDDVGPRGEHAAAVFHAHADRPVEWWDPVRNKTVSTSLHDAVDFWLQHLDVAMDASTEDRGQAGVSWRIQPKPGSRHRTLSSVGVGVSQVLPILVLGLLVSEGAMLLIEQPELHLHPRAQARLADFYLSLTATHKQVLIETHSDAMINQFRLLMVRDGASARDQINIYFAQQDNDGATTFEPIDIDDDGSIDNWPEGFFDENILLEDLIAGAALDNRLRGSENAPVSH